MKAEIDRDGCTSCGLCAETCPEVFRMAEDVFTEVYANRSLRRPKSVQSPRRIRAQFQ